MNNVSWGDIDKKPEPKYPFLRLSRDSEFKVRLLGLPIQVRKAYINTQSYILDDNQDTGNIRPTLRFAVNIIDRADGKIKIMEAPAQVFKQIMASHMQELAKQKPIVRPLYQRILEIFFPNWVAKKWPPIVLYAEPGGDPGLDLTVQVWGDHPKLTRYDVKAKVEKLSEDDKTLIPFDLDSVFKDIKSTQPPFPKL